jgi:zinc-ribbon domain
LICINKSRLKIYNKDSNPTYYLQDGQEFSIELYNPTSFNVLAKISLNGNLISNSGIVLRPAERVFLERYLNSNNKFKFETYQVSNTKQSKKAIEHNGDIKIEFFSEDIHISLPSVNLPASNIYFPKYDSNFYSTCTSWSPTSTPTYTVSNTANYTAPVNQFYSSNSFNTTNLSFDNLNNIAYNISNENNRSIETGRVEKGEESNQTFQYVDKTFLSYPMLTYEYKLLPVSQKLITSEDINVKVYCKHCGKKISKGDKFCSNCGKKQ